ncbi:PAAR domain-containing protein [Salmonella enterica subsp. enterica]|nr:PAAR domain-containing protein [Salmonella enterica subsp. enterica serovar Hessarek]
MLPIVRIGDKTTHGGAVISGSATMIFGNIGVARKGDKVTCPIEGHGPVTTIIEGNPNYLDNGIPVAFHGHRCACGCTGVISHTEELSVEISMLQQELLMIG